MATVVKPYTFIENTNASADEVNANFDAIFDWINNLAIDQEGDTGFETIPTLPATDPTSANHAVRKAYVDAQHTYAQINPSGLFNTSQGSFTQWAGSTNVVVPPWAGRANINVALVGHYPVNGLGGVVDLRVKFGAQAQTSVVRTTVGGTLSERTDKAWNTQILTPTKGTLALSIEAAKIGGTVGSFWQVDTACYFGFNITFLP